LVMESFKGRVASCYDWMIVSREFPCTIGRVVRADMFRGVKRGQSIIAS
jgi:hypothetical protein